MACFKHQDTFIGCTGSGIPNKIPVRMFQRPEKTRVLERSIERLMARAIMMGSKVPRSPSAPEISSNGEFLRVETLLRWRNDSLDAILQD